MTLTTGHVDGYDTDITITDHVRCHHTRHDHRLDHGSMLQCLYGGHYTYVCVSYEG